MAQRNARLVPHITAVISTPLRNPLWDRYCTAGSPGTSIPEDPSGRDSCKAPANGAATSAQHALRFKFLASAVRRARHDAQAASETVLGAKREVPPLHT